MIDLNDLTAIDISIPLRFNGPQPNAYGVEHAVSEPVKAGSLVGDTRQGGSVNFERYTFIPHCNGTHTECIGHITDQRISVRQCLKDVVIRAVLVTVTPVSVRGDMVISKESLDQGLASTDSILALIVRTLPNDDSKLTAEYGESNIPPYFSTDAIEYIVECGFKHLLVDMPSIDRLFDEGRLANHRIFWNVEPESRAMNPDTRLNNTITEMIYVPSDIADGEYVLNLQLAPFESDCSPSRPVLLRAT